mmetsp:Transcript_31595/g.55825  ORF Transcript_31595/g.55825 Transcript_31595/m.55825 type:complete len:224 (+) Transcript_31595:369-1040(+)
MSSRTSSNDSRDTPPVLSPSETSSKPLELPPIPELGTFKCASGSRSLPGPAKDGNFPRGFRRSRLLPTSSRLLSSGWLWLASCLSWRPFRESSRSSEAAFAPAPPRGARPASPSMLAAELEASGGVSHSALAAKPSEIDGRVAATLAVGGGDEAVVELALECQSSPPPLRRSDPVASPTSCSRMETSDRTRTRPASKATSVRLRRSLPRFDSGTSTERLCLNS